MYVGLDVHKDTIAMAVAREGRDVATKWKTIPYDGVRLRKALKLLRHEGEELRVCYEAGPTGFGLCRQRREAGIHCIVVERLTEAMATLVEDTVLAPLVKALQAFRGISVVSAVTIAAEVGGDLRRRNQGVAEGVKRQTWEAQKRLLCVPSLTERSRRWRSVLSPSVVRTLERRRALGGNDDSGRP